MELGSLDLIPFRFNVILKADFRSEDINGSLPPEPVGLRWPLRRPCLRGKSKRAQKTQKRS